MSSSSDNRIHDYSEFRWISPVEERDVLTASEKIKSKGITGILVPIGCLVTAGILGTGIFYMFKKDSKNQQRFMRLRVLSQGITFALALFGMSQFENFKFK